MIKPAVVAAPHAQSAHAAGSKASIIEQTAIPASILMALVAVNYSGVMTFASSYAFSVGVEGASIFFLVYAVTLLLCRVFVGKYTDQHGMTSVLLPGVVLMAISFITLALARNLEVFLVAAVLFGLGYGAVQPTLNAIVISKCSPSRRGAANATFFAALDLGIGVGAILWGVVSGAWGYPSIYWSGLLFFIAAGITGFILWKQDSQPAKRTA